MFPLERVEAEALAQTAPARAPESADAPKDERTRVRIAGPNGTSMTIFPIDHLRRLPLYEGLARARGWPVRAVWLVVHEVNDGLRAATGVTRIREGTPEYTIWLVARACVLHRLCSFAHEGEHIQQGHCVAGAVGYSREHEEPCDAAARLEVRGALAFAQRMLAAANVDDARCVTCCERGEDPCPQGAAVFEAVNRALDPL
jgi:hypothetical protein